MAEFEQLHIPALVQRFIGPEYTFGLHFGEGRQ